jgi:hypothetical protein
MVRIVGVQRHEEIGSEFVLLQNQGSMKVNLKGHVVAAQSVVDAGDVSEAIHIFSDDVFVLPGMYVLLRTCSGVGHWNHTHDRYSTYYAYMHRRTPVWSRHVGPLHVMAPQHKWVERKPEAALT